MSGVVYAPVGRLVEVLGVVSALKLAKRFGGGRLYVPQPERLKPEGAICATIGYDAAAKLAHEWRGLEIMVPRCVSYLVRERARAMHAEAKSMSVGEVARKYDMTERYAFMTLAEPPPVEDPAEAEAESAQRQLFS